MAQFDKDGHLIVKGNQYQVGELTNKLILMQGSELVEFLKSVGLNVPRKLRMGVLKNVLRQSVDKTIEERKSLADEMGYRLTWFSRYTDSQLVNLLEWYKSPSLSKKYLEELWVSLLSYMVDKGVSEDDLEQLFKNALTMESRNLPTTKLFNQQLEDVLFDDKGEIDGVTQSAFRPVTYKASTLTELRAIGDKFDAPIPKRLRKQEVLDIILVKLKERGTLTAELEAKLSGQNILLLERYAKDNDIKVSTELKKEEIIEYILSNAKETREVYFVPSSSAVYEKQVDEVEESFTTEVVEPVVEEVKVEDPVVEEVQEVVEEPVKEVIKEVVKVVEVEKPTAYREVIQTVDYKPEFDRLATAFETLAQAFEKKEFTININPVVSLDHTEQPNKEVDNSKLIKELLLADEDVNISAQPVQHIIDQNTVTTVHEVKAIEEDLSPVVVGKKFVMSKTMATLAGLFALLSGFIWLAFAVVMLPIESINQQATIQEYITFFDLAQFNTWYYVGGGALLGLFNLILASRILKRKIKRGSLIFFGLISLATGFVLTGLFMLLGSFKKSQPVLAAHPKDGVGRIVEAINSLGVNMSNPSNTKSKKGGKIVILAILIILFTAMLLFTILFAIWRLEFTYGYENIEILNFGAWLRDTIIKPIFGSNHYQSATTT